MKKLLLTGLGRSGTQWLVALLREDPKALVTHEWWPRRYVALQPMHNKAVALPGRSDVDWEARRLDDFKAMLNATDKEVYIEVNSKARYFVPTLQHFVPDMETMQLVRHGGDVIRSYYSRRTYKPADGHGPLEPGPGDPYREKWRDMDRFQKLCWMWGFTTHWLDERVDDFVRFETILSDYDVLYNKILRPYGLDISASTWGQRVHKRVDAHHHSFKLPHLSLIHI